MLKDDIEELAATRYGGMRFAYIVNALLKYFVNLHNVALQDEMLGRGSAALAADATIFPGVGGPCILQGALGMGL